MSFIAESRKFLIAAAAAVSAIVTANVLHGQVQHYAVLASTVLGALLVYVVPNAQKTEAFLLDAGPSLIAELKQVVTHPDVMSQILSTVKDELRKQAAQSQVSVSYQPPTAGPSTTITGPVAPLPPLIPPDSPA